MRPAVGDGAFLENDAERDHAVMGQEKRKYPPRGCSTPRQICLICRSRVIHKNDSRYREKVCRHCDELSLSGGCPSRPLRATAAEPRMALSGNTEAFGI
jgi:hypothetical protein